MPSSADIISFADRARQSLADARDDGDEGRIAHLERAIARDAYQAAAKAVKPKPTDIEFPLRSIPKWVPAD